VFKKVLIRLIKINLSLKQNMNGSLIETFDDNSKYSLKNLKVYVINLDRRSDRWNGVQKILYDSGFKNLERIPAIDGKQIDTFQLKKFLTERAFGDLGKERKADEDLGSLGAVGCFLSHYKAWMKVVESGVPAIIAEDDMIMDANMDNFECVKDSRLLEGRDLTLLGYCSLREKPKKPLNTSGLYDYDGMFFCTHFYYITPRGAEILLSESFPIDYQVDSYMGLMMKKHKITCAFHYPNLSWQNSSGTDIQTPLRSRSETPIQSTRVLPQVIVVLIIIVLLFCAVQFIFSKDTKL